MLRAPSFITAFGEREGARRWCGYLSDHAVGVDVRKDALALGNGLPRGLSMTQKMPTQGFWV